MGNFEEFNLWSCSVSKKLLSFVVNYEFRFDKFDISPLLADVIGRLPVTISAVEVFFLSKLILGIAYWLNWFYIEFKLLAEV